MGAHGQNNTMVGQQKLSLLDKMFFDFFLSSECENIAL
jgi:hypothetical protein